jgi:hypothetical protein
MNYYELKIRITLKEACNNNNNNNNNNFKITCIIKGKSVSEHLLPVPVFHGILFHKYF